MGGGGDDAEDAVPGAGGDWGAVESDGSFGKLLSLGVDATSEATVVGVQEGLRVAVGAGGVGPSGAVPGGEDFVRRDVGGLRPGGDRVERSLWLSPMPDPVGTVAGGFIGIR